MTLRDYLRADREANADSLKGRWLVCAFRWAWWFRRRGALMKLLGFPYLVCYRLGVEWILGVELPPLTSVGPGLCIHHGQGLVVNNRSVIGADCLLRHGVTIGNTGHGDEGDRCPVLEDGVSVGANAVVLGGITIGRGAVIGASAVVLMDVPAGSVAVGNPARILPRKGSTTAEPDNRTSG